MASGSGFRITFVVGFHKNVAVFFQESTMFFVFGLPFVGVGGVVSVSDDSVDESLSRPGLSCSASCCLEVDGRLYKDEFELSGQISSEVVIIFFSGIG
jgi:hypothetical protein